jgi:hypothetical protein
MTQVLVLVGTKRGAFIVRSDRDRERWEIRGPVANSGWAFGYLCFDPFDGSIYAAGQNAWYGPAVWRSDDLGESWTLSSEGLTYGDGRPGVKQIWNLTPVGGSIYAGVDPAGLFRSDDRGASWSQVGTPLLDVPVASEWRGGKGGLCLHSIVLHPTDSERLWVAIAGGGVLFTADGGRTWEPRNPLLGDDPATRQPGYRVQRLALAGGPANVLYQQNHLGVFRSVDEGLTWDNVTAGLPSPFGFPLAVHPRDRDTLFVIPHVNDATGRYIPGERIAIWRTQTGGDRWEMLSEGLPDDRAFVEVLRHGLATDSSDPAGVYFGTTSGQLYGSRDEGDTWSTLAAHLPEIYSVTATVVD